MVLKSSVVLLWVLGTACTVEPLRQQDLFAASGVTSPDAAASDRPGIMLIGARPDVDAIPAGGQGGHDAPAEIADAPGLDQGPGVQGHIDGLRPVDPDSPDLQTRTPDAGIPPGCSETLTGLVGGLVVDKCTGQSVNGLVGIFGRHQCSFAGKGSFCINKIPTGCALPITAKATGYKPYLSTVRVGPGGTEPFRIELERMSGTCAGPLPAGSTECMCSQPTCTAGCI